MNLDHLQNLALAVSPSRLERFRPPNGTDFAMTVEYLWNAQLSAALYQPLGALEVAMRNSIHRVLSALVGTEYWFDATGNWRLLGSEAAQIESAKASIRRTKSEEVRRGIDPVTPGRVISTLSFGFWTSLLAAAYGDSPHGPRFWNPKDRLLEMVIPNAVPHYAHNRKRVHTRINEVRVLRNRVFHYEPVCFGMAFAGHKNCPINEVYGHLLDTIDWFNSAMAHTVIHFDLFQEIYQDGRRLIAEQLRELMRR